VFRDGAWHPVGEAADLPPRPPVLDPLIPTGIALGVSGLLTGAIGVGWLASSGSSSTVCGLSGCIGFSDPEAQSSAVAVIAGGTAAALLGGTLAYLGSKGPTPPRRSNTRMVIGVAFTTLGISTAIAGVANALAPYQRRGSIPGEVSPFEDFGGSFNSSSENLMFTLSAVACVGVGLPLWITGARAPSSRNRASASSLDLLPSAGGAALRWTQ
jgi:hypothetical protein